MTPKEKVALKQQFEIHEHEYRRTSYRRAALLATVFILAAATLDFGIFPEFAGSFLMIRIIAAGLLIGVFFALKHVKNEVLFRVLGFLVALLPMLVIDWIIYKTGAGNSPYYGGLNTVLVGASLILRWQTLESILYAVLCVGGYLLIAFSSRADLEGSLIYTHIYFMFVMAAFACLGTYYYNHIRFREYLLIREVEGARSRLEDTNKQLRAIDETKSRFFANLSHELKTPLTLILGPAENLRANERIKGDRFLEEQLNTIEDNGFRLLRLINDILDLVKLDSGESMPQPELVDVEDLIQGITTHLKPITDLKGIGLSCECDLGDEREMWLDRDRLEKVLLNIAMNAVKFTDSGGEIKISAYSENRDLFLKIKDTGEGMSDEDIANIFVRFWQADMSARRKHRGAGIGLSLVKSLTESMGGDVRVDSELGEGTTFIVRIPIPKTPEGAVIDDQRGAVDVIEHFNEKARSHTDLQDVLDQGGEGVSPAGEALDGRTKRILVADDEKAMRRFIARQFKHYDLIEASDGREAWELAQEHQPDLIILDLMMPELDGIEVTEKIRAHEKLARVPIILVTAHGSEAPRLEALEAGVNDFISKPFSAVELEVRAKNLLNSSEFEVQLATSHENLESAYERLKEQESLLVQTEKLSSLGRMSAGIIHEVNNPLNYTKTALHALQTFKSEFDEEVREEYLDILGDAQEGVQRVIGIISDLRSFTRGEKALMGEVHLADVVESARRLSSASMAEIHFDVEVDDSLKLDGNEGLLCQLLMNFFQNSARAIQVKGGDEQGEIQVRAGKDEGGGVFLSIRDNGCGISKEDQERIFEPFFTKNDVGEGMGLGLSICHRILKQHNATVSIHSEVGIFTEFRIMFGQEEVFSM